LIYHSDFCYKSFELGNLGVASFKVSQAFNVLGMATWDAGFFLAEYIMAYPGTTSLFLYFSNGS